MSGEFYFGTFGEISSGIDIRALAAFHRRMSGRRAAPVKVASRATKSDPERHIIEAMRRHRKLNG